MATGVAKAMKEKFGDQLELKVLLNDSVEARNYALKGSTNVYINGEWIPLDVATSKKNMKHYLRKVLG
jgi:transglutaminase-like putative cysteine protease